MTVTRLIKTGPIELTLVSKEWQKTKREAYDVLFTIEIEPLEAQPGERQRRVAPLQQHGAFTLLLRRDLMYSLLRGWAASMRPTRLRAGPPKEGTCTRL